jgi:hypothetical protein
MYDFDHKGSICHEDLLDILTLMIGGNVTKDQLVSIAMRYLQFVCNDFSKSLEPSGTFLSVVIIVQVKSKVFNCLKTKLAFPKPFCPKVDDTSNCTDQT